MAGALNDRVAAVALAGLFLFAISFDVIGDMFRERAKIAQVYDVGSSGRFTLSSTVKCSG